MAETKIEWADFTFNPWLGCSKVSPACKNCYAEGWAKRSGLVQWGDRAERRRTSESYWRQPLKWNKEAEKSGERRRVFCASLADVFEDRPELGEWRGELFKLIQTTPHLDWLLLTKRPEHWEKHLNQAMWRFVSANDVEAIRFANGWLTGSRIPSNIWIGTTVENQEQADKRIPELLKIPARVRFLSCEPLLGPLNLSEPGMGLHCESCIDRLVHWCVDPVIHWVIAGGESGANARPTHPRWFYDLSDQCKAAGVPFLFKQHGEFLSYAFGDMSANELSEYHQAGAKMITVDLDGRYLTEEDDDSNASLMVRVGKKAAGRRLAGREWNQFPEAA